MLRRAAPFLVLGAAFALSACRGDRSEKPPIHLIPDMDSQQKLEPQEVSPLFADGRGDRPLVEGVMPRGQLLEDDGYERGKKGDAYIDRAPVKVDRRLLTRGQERFDIYCSVCHDRTGSGRGMVVQRGYPPPVDLAQERVRGLTDGEIFNVISHGVRNMPAYGKQIPVADRWAIVLWVRVLQESQHGTVDSVPFALRERIEPEVSAQ